MESVRAFEHKGLRISIVPDDDPQDPRKDCDNLTVMAFFHKRYGLGDKGHGYRTEDYGGWDELEAAIIDAEDPAVICRVGMIDHSGLSIYLGGGAAACDPGGWDSGTIGFVWMTKKAARENWGWKRISAKRLEQVKDFIRGDIQAYDDYLTGSVYGYVVERPAGDPEDGEWEAVEDGSLFGYFGYETTRDGGECVRDAIAVADRAAEEIRLEGKDDPRQLALGMEVA